MSRPTVETYPGPEEVANRFVEILWETARKKEAFNLAISGGSTPKLAFQKLGKMADADWSAWNLFWVDERCVLPDHPDSNYGLTWEHWLKPAHFPERQVHRMMGEMDPEEGARHYEKVLKEKLSLEGGLPVFDLMALGMGADGHTASIFPNQTELLKSSDHVAVARHPESGQHRLTLTGPVINAARKVVFVVTGASKAEKVAAVLEGKKNGSILPAADIDPDSGELIWLLDAAAASRLNSNP